MQIFFLQTSTTQYFFLKQNENCETKRPPRRSSQHQLAISLIPIYYTLELCTTCIGTRIYVVSFFKFSRAFLLIESCGRSKEMRCVTTDRIECQATCESDKKLFRGARHALHSLSLDLFSLHNQIRFTVTQYYHQRDSKSWV